MCNEVRYFFRRRDRCFKRYKRTLSAQDKFYFYIARREANTAERNGIKRYNEKTINSFNDPNLKAKTFWKLSKKILGDESENSIPPLRENNTLVPDDTDKANIYNDYFTSLSSLDPKQPEFNCSIESRIEHISTNELEVYRLLTKLNQHKSTGPDDIGNLTLKNCWQSPASPLSILFNTSLDSGTFPNLWKLAHVCPVYKKGDKSDKTNYPPISLLSNTSKILQK